MRITKEESLTLIGELWADKYPLVRKYFGKYLQLLIKALLEEKLIEGRFFRITIAPQKLEQRLQSIERWGQTGRIISEIGEIENPIELDRRLMDAWAELRTLSQIGKEGFHDITKVTESADLSAVRGDEKVVFSVKRINNSLDNQVQRRNGPANRDSDPYGEISEIYSRLEGPLSYLFWGALNEKNGKFSKWIKTGYKRCIVIVSGDEDLQDSMVRHIACREIREGIHLLGNRHFEELLWLPDTGHGAWFKVGSELQKTYCFADWGVTSEPTLAKIEESMNRRKVNLDNVIPE